jgi:hypothetical protein
MQLMTSYTQFRMADLINYKGFNVARTVTMKSTVFWDATQFCRDVPMPPRNLLVPSIGTMTLQHIGVRLCLNISDNDVHYYIVIRKILESIFGIRQGSKSP